MNIDWSNAPEWAQELAVNPYNEKAWLGDDGYSYLVGNGGVVPWSHETAFARTAFKNIEDRPEPWTGEGLPPVGTVCAFCRFPSVQESEWQKVEIVAHWSEGLQKPVAIFMNASFAPQADQAIAECFRPIRTPEQIAAEEREKAIKEMIDECPYPGSECTRIDCQALYEAGYRKQVTP